MEQRLRAGRPWLFLHESARCCGSASDEDQCVVSLAAVSSAPPTAAAPAGTLTVIEKVRQCAGTLLRKQMRTRNDSVEEADARTQGRIAYSWPWRRDCRCGQRAVGRGIRGDGAWPVDIMLINSIAVVAGLLRVSIRPHWVEIPSGWCGDFLPSLVFAVSSRSVQHKEHNKTCSLCSCCTERPVRLVPAVLVVHDVPCVLVAHVLFPMFLSTVATPWHAGEPQPDAEWSPHGERVSLVPNHRGLSVLPRVVLRTDEPANRELVSFCPPAGGGGMFNFRGNSHIYQMEKGRIHAGLTRVV